MESSRSIIYKKMRRLHHGSKESIIHHVFVNEKFWSMTEFSACQVFFRHAYRPNSQW